MFGMVTPFFLGDFPVVLRFQVLEVGIGSFLKDTRRRIMSLVNLLEENKQTNIGRSG